MSFVCHEVIILVVEFNLAHMAPNQNEIGNKVNRSGPHLQ